MSDMLVFFSTIARRPRDIRSDMFDDVAVPLAEIRCLPKAWFHLGSGCTGAYEFCPSHQEEPSAYVLGWVTSRTGARSLDLECRRN
jgi:hypothetical protein